MRTLAILQNQWGAVTPEKQARLNAMPPDAYSNYVKFCLRGGCVSGQRLAKAFGEDFERIVWTNASRNVSEKASASFAPDPSHLASTMEAVRPEAVIVFGKVAADGFETWAAYASGEHGFILFVAPHPAARHVTVQAELNRIAQAWKALPASPQGEPSVGERPVSPQGKEEG